MSSARSKFPIESLLSARQLVAPEISGDKVFFIANFAGSYGLYTMPKTGGVPVPLIPEGTALQNPHLMDGKNFVIFPNIDKILIMIDENGNELYQPCTVPLDGGIPEPLFGNRFSGQKLTINDFKVENNTVFFNIDDRKTPGFELLAVDLKTMKERSFGKTKYGTFASAVSDDLRKMFLGEAYSQGDTAIFYWEEGSTERKLLYGTPLEHRKPGEIVKPNNLGGAYFVEDDKAALVYNGVFSDTFGIGYLQPSQPGQLTDVPIIGTIHKGSGELVGFDHLVDDLFLLSYNIDGGSITYETKYVAKGGSRRLEVLRPVLGLQDPVSSGVLLGLGYDRQRLSTRSREYVASFTKATSPSQLYMFSADGTKGKSPTPIRLSDERVLGIPENFLSKGEDASFTSFDGLRISARLYRPGPDLGYSGKRPLVLYVHGGPTSQERPDFTWFSMPLIQFLTLHGFAVFVPNVRGSTGYGFAYTSKVFRDWGGADVKDHIEGLKMLEKDARIDSGRRGVVGRSYGGYMTLTLLSRHPDLWKAGCDMFGPYDLIGFYKRLPPTWQVAFDQVLGNPEKDRDFLIERSPKTYFERIKAPLLVIQGKNDPRVLLAESVEVVESMKNMGKNAELLVFEDEGHDVIKFKNKVKCYQDITNFFIRHLLG